MHYTQHYVQYTVMHYTVVYCRTDSNSENLHSFGRIIHSTETLSSPLCMLLHFCIAI